MKPALSRQTFCYLTKNFHQLSSVKPIKVRLLPIIVSHRNIQANNNPDPELAKKMRRFQISIATVCFAFAIGTYCFTLYSIQQEKFLDDFDMPEQIDRTEKDE